MFKKILLMGMVLALLGVVAFSKPVVQWWVWNWDSEWQAKTWTAKAQEFENSTGIHVEIINQPWNKLGEKIRASSMAGNPPDVVMILHSDYSWLAASGLLKDITEIARADIDLSDFKEGALASVSVDGKLYGLPWRRAGYALVYNADLLRQVGIYYPPNTLEEVKDYAARVTALGGGVYGWAMPLSGTSVNGVFYRWENIFFSYGGDWLNEDKTDVAPGFLNAATAAFRFHADMAKYAPPSKLEDNDDDVIRLAALGRVAMWQDHMSAVSTIDALMPPELHKAIGYALMPEGRYDAATNTSYRMTSVGGWDIVIPAQAPNPEGAWKFFKFWVSAQNMGNTTLGIPVRISSMSNPRIAVYPEPFVQGEIKSTLGEAFSPEVRSTVWEQTQAVVLGMSTPEQAAKIVADKVKSLLAE